MARKLLGALFALLLTACAVAAPVPQAPSHRSIAERLADETVALVDNSDPEDPNRVFCSGVWVGPGLFLTADHCMADVAVGGKVEYIVESDIADGATDVFLPRPATLLAEDESHDLALVRTPNPPPHASAAVSRRWLSPGDPVFTMGAPLGLVWSFSSGEIAAIRYWPAGDLTAWFVQATAPISPGSSGCGLFDPDGSLVGIARGVFKGGEMVNMFVHRDYIARFVKAHPG